jgi:hypothetical protein
VEVTILVYEWTLQAEALGLVATKTRASLMVEGELAEEGLAALSGDGTDVFLALAPRLAEPIGTRDQRQSLEALFAEARRDEDISDELVVEGGWGSNIEPDRELTPSARHTIPLDGGSFTDLPLITTAIAASPSESGSVTGKVVTFEELACLLCRPKPRRRVAPEGQLALFGT